MGRPQKTKRNKKLMDLRKKGLSYAQLARVFKIDIAAVHRIVKRESNKELIEQNKGV